jgi:hypothetical protein
MDIGIYRSFIEIYVKEALENSDRTNAGISEYLHSLKESGRFTSHRAERNLALAEVRKAFDDHRHWPLSIILSFLGIENKELTTKKG